MDVLQNIIFALNELEQDSSTPKNVKLKLVSAIKVLGSSDEVSIRVSKALQALEDVADDSTVQPFVRTQIFNIVSQLETV